METNIDNQQGYQYDYRSYRTYEEWKHNFVVNRPLSNQRSYRTYEEWKRLCFCCCNFRKYSSYRTYEEWKHNSWIDENA